MTLDAAELEAFRDLLGPDGVVEDAHDRAPYETGARYGGGRAAAVLRPATTAQVSAVVARCVARCVAFVPQSGNTGLAGSSVPDASGDQVVLSLDRLKAPLEVNPQDRTAICGAGVRLSALNAALEPYGLFLPIDLGPDPMLGGMAATNTGGARFLRYGDMRRHVLGLEVVLADARGTVLDLMSDLRKDNAHLDLRQLFVGSSGAFGIITKVAVEVHHRPQETAAALCVPAGRGDALIRLLCALEARAGEHLSAFEFMSRPVIRRALAHVPSLRNPFAGAEPPGEVALVEVSRNARAEGEPPLDELLQTVLGDIAAQDDSPLSDALFGPPEQMWALRHSLSEGLRAAGPVIGMDLSFSRSKVMAFRAAVAPDAARLFPEYELCDFGHLGDGGVHFNFVPARPGAHDPARAEALKNYVIDRAVKEFGGSFSGEHGMGRSLQAYYDRLVDPQLQTYAARLTAALGVAAPAHLRYGPPPAQ